MTHTTAHSHDVTRVVHRTITRRDIPFITNSFLKSYETYVCSRYTPRGKRFTSVDRRVYYDWHHRILEAIIPSSTVIVGSDKDDPDRIYGYGIARFDTPDLILHYIYVRDGWRGVGIGTSILQAFLERFSPRAIVSTHWTVQGHDFIKSRRQKEIVKLPHIHNPYMAVLELP